jgi:transposase InsO family protein
MSDAKIFAKELKKPIKTDKTIKRRSVFAMMPDELWAGDLVDVSNIKNSNNNLHFILNIIDVYSRFVWSFPLKNKKAESILNALESMPTACRFFWVDKGKEFYNKDVKKWTKEHNVDMYSTGSPLKSVFIERFNRTQKDAFYSYFLEHNHTKYTSYLKEFTDEYNHRIHSSTQVTPDEL